MGKPSQRSQDVNDLEERRCVARELNEATKDAVAILRRLTAEVRELDEQLRTKAVEIIQPMLDRALADIAELVRRSEETIAGRTQELLGIGSTEEMFEKLSIECLEVMRPAIIAVVEETASAMTRVWLEKNLKAIKLSRRGLVGLAIESEQSGDEL